MKKNLPNILTILRGFITLAIILLFSSDYGPKYEIIFWLFVVAVGTDFFDGYLARSWNAVSDFGIIFDPLFDKVLILSMLFFIFPLNIVPGFIIVLLFIRDIIIDSLRSYLKSRGTDLPAIISAKIKTALQMIMLGMILIYLNSNYPPMRSIVQYIAYLALIFSLWSAVIYFKNFRKLTKK